MSAAARRPGGRVVAGLDDGRRDGGESGATSRVTRPAVLVGRDDELTELSAVLDQAATGEGSTILVAGEAGTGKSALLHKVVEDASSRGLTVLRTRGAVAEEHLPFAALHRLLMPLAAGFDRLPPVHRTALREAFGLEEVARLPERFFVALASLELIIEASLETPVLVAVDDRQWLDQASRDVVDFVGRRVDDQHIAVALTERRTAERVERAAHTPVGREVLLSELDAAASLTLLQHQHPELSQIQRDQVLGLASGNPLALLELPALIVDRPQRHRAGPPALSGRLHEAFASRISSLSPAGWTATLIAALQDSDSVHDTIAALARVSPEAEPAAALDDAVRSGLLSVGEGTIRFGHPLMHAAVETQASDLERRQAHDALAVGLSGMPDRAAWHRASALIGPDAGIAEELDRRAEHAAARGATGMAKALFDHAIRLSDEPSATNHRKLRVAELAFELGQFSDVRRLIGSVRADELDAADGARLVGLEMAFDDGAPDGPEAVRRFASSARMANLSGDDRLAAGLLVVAARITHWGGTADELARPILNAAAGLGDDPTVGVLLMIVDAFLRPFERGTAISDRLAALSDGSLDDETTALLSQAGFVIGDFQRSLQLAQRAAFGLRRDGRLALLAADLVLQSFTALYLGRWDLTLAASEEASRLAEETHQPVWAACARLGQANLAGLRGSREIAVDLASTVEQVGLLTGNAALLNGVQLSRGLAALGADDPAGAWRELVRMFDRQDKAYQSPQCAWAIDYLAEAALSSGHLDDGREVLATVTELVGPSCTSGIERTVSLAAFMLADDSDREQRYAACSRVSSTPWHQARRDLHHGAWLRRRHATGAARTVLGSAAATFHALGATAWAARAQRELAAAGVHQPSQGRPENWSRLSAQELQVATLAADGLSNREIAARLYLSQRTVGSHLYRIYPKLGVTSRTQLHRALTQ